MKKILIFSIVIMLYLPMFGQQTVLVTRDDDPTYYEEYSVLASNKKMKHGNYFKINRSMAGYAIHASGAYVNGRKNGYWETYFRNNNNIKEKGFYKNDLRDSIWIFFYAEGDYKRLVEVQSGEGASLKVLNANPVISKTGSFRNGAQIGIWEFFDEHGQLHLKFDFDTQSIVWLKGQSLETHEAGFVGGELLLSQHVYDTFDFEGLRKSINDTGGLVTGKLVFKFTVDEHGTVKDIVCTEKTIRNKKIYERAVETVSSLNRNFYPKKVNDTCQAVEKTMTFDLTVESKTTHTATDKYMYSSTRMDFDFKIKVQ